MNKLTVKVISVSLTTVIATSSLMGCGLNKSREVYTEVKEVPQGSTLNGKIDVSQYISGEEKYDTPQTADPVETDVPVTDAMPEDKERFDISMEAPVIMANAFHPELKMTSTVQGGRLEIGVSGDNEYITLHMPDDKGTASFYLLNRVMYLYQTGSKENSVTMNYKISEDTFDADPNTSTSETDIISTFASAGDPSKYSGAEKMTEADLDGVTYLPIAVADEDGSTTICYINENTGKCDYMDMESMNMYGTEEKTRFKVEQGSAITEQEWMSGSVETDVNTFISSMLGFILMVFTGDVSINYGQ